ncbi:MAG: SEC-C metal-binding domain-containing protein [Clostridia bacterium]
MRFNVEQTSLKEILKKQTKDELKDLTYIYPVKGKSKLKKEELVNALYEIMTNEEILNENAIILTTELNEEKHENNDMLKIRKIIDLGYGKILGKNDEIKIILAYEIEDISSKISEDLKKEILRYSLIKRYLLACVRFYGVIEIDFFIELFNEQNTIEDELDYEELNIQLNRCIKMGLEPDRYENCIVSKSLFMFEGEIETLMCQRENKEFYILSKEELLKYEDEFYIEKNKQYMEFDKFVHNKVKNREISEGLVEDLAYVLRFKNVDIQYAINEFNRRKITFDSLKEVEEFMHVYVNLINNTRNWANKGYTPYEISDNKQSTNLHKVHVGRNDLCPCGSGHKYKKCCLNNN